MKFENTDVWGFEHAIRGMYKGGLMCIIFMK